MRRPGGGRASALRLVRAGTWAAAVLALATSTAWAKTDRSPEADSLFVRARAAPSAREAETLYRSLLERFPGDALADDALFALALQHYSLGRTQTAEEEFAAVVDRYRRGNCAPHAAYWHGVALLTLGRVEAAVEEFGRLAKHAGDAEDRARARTGIGDALRLKGDLSGAMKAYEEVLEEFPGSRVECSALFHLAEAYERTGDKVRAWALYARLEAEYPDSYEGALATAVLVEGERSEAGADEDLGRTPGRPWAGAPDSSISAPRAVESERLPPARTLWRVQVGAFAGEDNASRLARRLETSGYGEVRVESEEAGPQVIYRVYVGAFASVDSAHARARTLREEERLDADLKPWTPPAPEDF